MYVYEYAIHVWTAARETLNQKQSCLARVGGWAWVGSVGWLGSVGLGWLIRLAGFVDWLGFGGRLG